MDLKQARTLYAEIHELIGPHCKQIELVGSARRQKPFPGDIDIVLIPGNQGALAMALRDLGPKIKSGPKIHACKYKGQQVDIYIADEMTWPTLMLIRTGSKEHNIKLCARARDLGGQLHADGSGLELIEFDSGKLCRFIPKDEAHIFEMLGLKYVGPERRER